MVKRTGSIEFRDSPGVSSLSLFFLFFPHLQESPSDSVTPDRAGALVSFLLLLGLYARKDDGVEGERGGESTRSITGDPSGADKFYRIMCLPRNRRRHSRSHSKEIRNIVATSTRGHNNNRFPFVKKKRPASGVLYQRARV